MPFDRRKYPADWDAIRAEVLERAGNKCEECGIENHRVVIRGKLHDQAVYQGDDGGKVYDADTSEVVGEDYIGFGDPKSRFTKIVLTISHTDHDTTNNGEPGDRSNLRALCQYHHFKHDRDHHTKNSAATRKRKRGMADLFE